MQTCEKIRGVRVFIPVGYSGSLSTVNETNCNKKERFEQKNCELTSNSIRMRTTMRNLEMKANIAILYVGQLERWRSVIFGENFLSLSYASLLTSMDGLFNWFS